MSLVEPLYVSQHLTTIEALDVILNLYHKAPVPAPTAKRYNKRVAARLNTSPLGPAARPMAIKSQLYALVKNKHGVEKDLARMKAEGKIVVVNSSDNLLGDECIMRIDDYRRTCCAYANKLKETVSAASHELRMALFSKFVGKVHLLPKIVSEQTLASTAAISPQEISILVEIFALTEISEALFALSLPYLSSFTWEVKMAHQELSTFLLQCKAAQIPKKTILKNKFKYASAVGLEYMLTYFIGGLLIKFRPSAAYDQGYYIVQPARLHAPAP